MNDQMAYLLGLICGNGEVQRSNLSTTFSIDIPHKKLKTETENDVKVYVKASISDIRTVLEPLLGTGLTFTQGDNHSFLSFTKSNDEYITQEILRFIDRATSHENIRLSSEIFEFTNLQKLQFLRGFSDVTGYIRRSNHFIIPYVHRVYLEVPRNWYLVIDVCNLLKSIDIPVQTIDWGHPNIRDGNLTKCNQGQLGFWKKEHQIKIYANEFMPIGFGILHKKQALEIFNQELIEGFLRDGKEPDKETHKFYWERRKPKKDRLDHPGEGDSFIPEAIRGKHFNSWSEIARDLGYGK